VLLISLSFWDIADLMVLQTCIKLQITLTLSHFTPLVYLYLKISGVSKTLAFIDEVVPSS
jgi:hypothetical protein